LENENNIARDLFGEPVTEARTRRSGRFAAPLKSVDVDKQSPSDVDIVQLAIPARFSVEGSLERNPLRQIATRSGAFDGTLSPIQIGKLSAFRFTPASGQSFLIVAKKTLATPSEPILLVPGGDSIAGIVEGASKGTWLGPKPLRASAISAEEGSSLCERALDSWEGQFTFREGGVATEDGPAVPGLRTPQIGALHAALAHMTSSTQPATIVMPTGTGKTETMLAVYAHQRISRLMVVVPTDALRDQIATKFETFGVLQDQGCLGPAIEYPLVLRLEHIPKTVEQVDALFGKANVIITTMSIAGRADALVQERMAQLCGALFIDEAHHVSAKTWREFRAWFMQGAGSTLILQFTATPFREDGGKVDGKFIYYYPLAKAQAEHYFGKIKFHAVNGLEDAEADAEILSQLARTLDADRAKGLNHLAMVRCRTIGRAETLHQRYLRELPQYHPVIVHSKQKAAERHQNLMRLRRFESQIIVCVDMLGEGFDLPELKIAAIHDVFKSIAVTLQFVGRFSRARSDLGDATVIANTDQDRVDRALSKLYAEEADWNFLIANISGDRAGKEMERAEVFAGFTGDLTEIPLQTIETSMNTYVFNAPGCERWDPHRIEDLVATGSFVGMKLNERERIAVCVLRHETQAKWTKSSTAIDTSWELLLAHWDEQNSILYMSSTGGSISDKLAKAVCGEATLRIRDQAVFRCFHEFKQLVIRNLGMTHRQGGGTRYSMLMGIDVSDGIDSLKKVERIQNNIFGSGFEEGEPRTLGCSIKGKFWSQAKIRDLTDWTRWCHHIGALLTNESIPNSAAFASAMVPKAITERPDAHPLTVHWPESVLLSYEERVELSFGGVACAVTECDLVLANHERSGPLAFVVRYEDQEAKFEVVFRDNQAFYPQVSGPPVAIKTPRREMPLSDFFADDAPQIDFGDGSFLIYSHLYVPPNEIDLAPVLDNALTSWDWGGTNVRVESQGPDKRSDSIQFRVIEELKKEDFDIIFDDDGSGEFADVITMKVRENVVELRLCHCKYSSDDKPGRRLDDLYEVAGQALKSVQFCHKPKRFIRNMINREKRQKERGLPSRFEKGNIGALRQIDSRREQYRFAYEVWIVQPGISKAKLSQPMLQLLGFVEKSLLEHRRIPLRVILSA
jgi:superfamily II DNA or RNA helicase